MTAVLTVTLCVWTSAFHAAAHGESGGGGGGSTTTMEAHQLMLATESPVFARLLAEVHTQEALSGEQQPQRKARSAEVRVTVASATALAAVLEFVYEGTARVPHGQLLEVAAMARRLRMERLSALSAYHLVCAPPRPSSPPPPSPNAPKGEPRFPWGFGR